jgi:hypothetical protein
MIVVERHMSNISDILWREQLVALSYLDKDTLFLLLPNTFKLFGFAIFRF